MNTKLLCDLEAALNIVKKNGDLVFPDQKDMEVCVAGTFANDKFIVIKRRERPDVSNC